MKQQIVVGVGMFATIAFLVGPGAIGWDGQPRGKGGGKPQGETGVVEPPADLAATGGDGFVRLTWKPPPSGSAVSRYYVLRGLTRGGPYALIAEAAASQSEYRDAGLPNCVQQFYVLRSVADDGTQSGPSREVGVRPEGPPPGPPAGLEATSPSPGVVRLRWNQSAEQTVVEYLLYRSRVKGDLGKNIAKVPRNVTTYVDNFPPEPPESGGPWYYAVRARNACEKLGPACEQIRVSPYLKSF